MCTFKVLLYRFQPVSRILLLTDSLVSDGRNPSALETAVGAAMSCGKVENALLLFEAMKHRNLPLRPHYFWPLFIAAGKNDGEKGWQYVLDIIRGLSAK
jgi:leucine-rich PPR motif-containing protein